MGRIKNTELTSFGMFNEEMSEDERLGNHVQESLDHRKLSIRGGHAQIYITDKFISITNGSNGLAVGESGNVIGGPTHFMNMPSDLHISMFWRFNDELLTTLPSTVYTPIPVLRYEEPDFSKSLQKLMSLLG